MSPTSLGFHIHHIHHLHSAVLVYPGQLDLPKVTGPCDEGSRQVRQEKA